MTDTTTQPGTLKIPPLADAPCFIERQFPVAKVSMESYKERKGVQSQTLTGLGKWWGRKPLILVRAALLGLLLPATADAVKDREIFLMLLTMDDEGLWQRKNKSIAEERLLAELAHLPPTTRARYLDPAAPEDTPALLQLDSSLRQELQRLVFRRMPYDEKLTYCDRPEQIEGPSPAAWQEINVHLGTHAANLQELVLELGRLRFGHIPRVGDAFCGGGSIPFEAARLGCEAYGSDLNPVAAMLTWGALNILGGGENLAKQIQAAQQQVYRMVDAQVTEWGIEHNSRGWRADTYLYCVEVVDPESGWRVPLLPKLAIAPGPHVIARLQADAANKSYNIMIQSDVSPTEYTAAENTATVHDSRLVPPDGGLSTPIESIRRSLRSWENEDVVPRPGDVFQERLYCIRWIETYTDARGELRTRRHYRAPVQEDLQREQKVLALLRERFVDWQARGCLPTRQIVSGYNTDQPIRERGWTHWHHLFNPRQLLYSGSLINAMLTQIHKKEEIMACLLGVGKCCDWNSKLCRWGVGQARESSAQTFYNQALNTLSNYGVKGFTQLVGVWFLNFKSYNINRNNICIPLDARQLHSFNDIWLTDPPYADAVNYEELSEFFLAWYEKSLPRLFPDWYVDSKRALAVKGSTESFRQAMVTCYRRLTEGMPENGLQLVMFTHQDAAVWADLSLILWAAGLRVTAAWTIATETETSFRTGNYVQGTVLLVLRKRIDTESAFMDEINPRIEAEVRQQLNSMLSMDDSSDPNFSDTDYQLAAYAAALRVLTAQPIEEIDPVRELNRTRKPGEVGAVEAVIRNAVRIACDHLVPRDLPRGLWREMEPMERFYLKGLEVESHGEYRSGVYQELARGYGAAQYDDLLASTRANETRLKTASEFGSRMLASAGFGSTLLRQCLYAVALTVERESTRVGLAYLHTELKDYWALRQRIIGLLDYLARLRQVSSITHWHKDADAAALLAGAVNNDHG